MNEVISARTRERDVANTDSELIAGTCNPALSTDRPIAILLIVPNQCLKSVTLSRPQHVELHLRYLRPASPSVIRKTPDRGLSEFAESFWHAGCAD